MICACLGLGAERRRDGERDMETFWMSSAVVGAAFLVNLWSQIGAFL